VRRGWVVQGGLSAHHGDVEKADFRTNVERRTQEGHGPRDDAESSSRRHVVKVVALTDKATAYTSTQRSERLKTGMEASLAKPQLSLIHYKF